MRTIARDGDRYAALLAAGDVHGRLAELWGRAAVVGETTPERVAELLQECAHLGAMTEPGADDRVLLHLRPIGGLEAAVLDEFGEAYLHLFPKSFGFSAARVACEAAVGAVVLLEMPAIGRLVGGEIGTHLFYLAGQHVLPVQVRRVPLGARDSAADASAVDLGARRDWCAKVAAGAVAPDSDPHRLGDVIRVYDAGCATLDLRTGLLCDGLPRGEDLRRFILAAMPVPASLAESNV
jgi:hypothetical protein